MKRTVKYITLADFLFIALLSLAGMLEGAFSEVVYYIGYILPIIFLAATGKDRFSKNALALLEFPKESAMAISVLAAPTILLVLAISFLTSLFLSLFLEPTPTVFEENLFLVILLHAILPAFLEEFLFRYMPICLMKDECRNTLVFTSTVLFAFAHCNIYQIPYALAAGMIFIIVDLLYESVWPSVILHFANNLFSIFWIKYSGNLKFVISSVIVLSALSLVSCAVLFKERNKYLCQIRSILSDKKEEKMGYELIFFVVITFIAALTNLSF